VHQNVLKLADFGLSRRLTEISTRSDINYLLIQLLIFFIFVSECWQDNPDDRPNIQQVASGLKLIIDLNAVDGEMQID
jgi:hypothetical protein